MFAEGDTVITDTECVDTSYPGFYKAFEQVAREYRRPR
jgi:5-enolpyruvylshikimate-3-phosphate synthase